MITRTIMIFPEFENIEVINNIRTKYDPLAYLVLPHITLVFPFESGLTNEELKLHLEESLKGIRPFKITLEGFRKQQDQLGNYLFLNVTQGLNEIKDIHHKLYKDKLEPYKSSLNYIPHMTVGKLTSTLLLDEAYDDVIKCNDKFTTMVEKISVEMICEHDESIIIIEHYIML
jgi:2'-5' RNA ligase